MSNLSSSCSVVLLGFMGAGKSTISTLLAERLELAVIDLDRLIETRESQLIPEIFAQQGEEGFRRCETLALQSLISAAPAVIATGGGVVTQQRNWPLLRTLGLSVYLKAELPTLLARIGSGEGRPLAQAGTHRLTSLFLARQPLYEMADFSVQTDRVTPEVVCDLILNFIHTKDLSHA